MDQAFSAIHQANRSRLPFTLIFGHHDGAVGLHCRYPAALQELFEKQLLGCYPECRIEPIDDGAFGCPEGHETWTTSVWLVPEVFPIRRYSQFHDDLNRVTADPLMSVLAMIPNPRESALRGSIELHARPASRRRLARARRILHQLDRPFFRLHPRIASWFAHVAVSPRWYLRYLAWLSSLAVPRHAFASRGDALSTSPDRLHQREEDLQAGSDKLTKMLYEVELRFIVHAPAGNEDQAITTLGHLAGGIGQFGTRRQATFRCSRPRHGSMKAPSSFLLSSEELATIFHPPTATVQTETLSRIDFRELEPPARLASPDDDRDVLVLGETAFRSRRQRFGIPSADRLHMAMFGKTGMGKSTLLKNLLAADIHAGRGVACIDPHGDLAESVLEMIPKQRTNDVVVFDAGDASFPVSFNLLSCPDPTQRPLVASGVVSAFKKLYADSWGPRLEHIFRNATLALLDVPDASLVSVLPLLIDPAYRARMMHHVRDPVVRDFWLREFANMPPRLQAEAIAPVQNKVGHFVSNPLLRHIIGQARTTLDLRRAMDENHIVIVNLSKGRIGDDASTLLGSLLVTAFHLAAMTRADMPEIRRSPFYLYVDEAHSFASDSFASILSEGRKYGLFFGGIATQFLEGFDEKMLASIFGNVSTHVSFQLGQRDAEIVAEQLGGDLQPEDLLALPKYHAYTRLLIDGRPCRPFSIRTLPPPAFASNLQKPSVVRRTSRHRYTQPVAHVKHTIEHSLKVA